MGISKDMKYTALYWALRFVETELDVHRKSYNGYEITIYAEEQAVDFGNRIKCNGKYPLTSHKSFVVLECVDRLLSDGYLPEQIILCENYDIKIDGTTNINCIAWDNYACSSVNGAITYASRLVSGLLEYKGCFLKDGAVKEFGFGVQSKENIIANKDFEIIGDELVRYKGNDSFVHIPDGIVSIGASAFWNNTFVSEVILPRSLERIGGDCFYYCTNLERVTIPEKVCIMGNNPFAGCPKLVLENESPHFILENGVLYDKQSQILFTIRYLNPIRNFLFPIR